LFHFCDILFLLNILSDILKQVAFLEINTLN